jgi:hypothetical protein
MKASVRRENDVVDHYWNSTGRSMSSSTAIAGEANIISLACSLATAEVSC